MSGADTCDRRTSEKQAGRSISDEKGVPQMGSWAELDANYPPGALSPAAAVIVALCHLAGTPSIYAADGGLASFLPRRGLSYDHELLARAEGYLQEVEIGQFLEQARAMLNPEQKLCLALNLLDYALAADIGWPEDHPLLARMLEGLGLTAEQIGPHWQTLAIKNELSLFPQ